LGQGDRNAPLLLSLMGRNGNVRGHKTSVHGSRRGAGRSVQKGGGDPSERCLDRSPAVSCRSRNRVSAHGAIVVSEFEAMCISDGAPTSRGGRRSLGAHGPAKVLLAGSGPPQEVPPRPHHDVLPRLVFSGGLQLPSRGRLLQRVGVRVRGARYSGEPAPSSIGSRLTYVRRGLTRWSSGSKNQVPPYRPRTSGSSPMIRAIRR